MLGLENLFGGSPQQQGTLAALAQIAMASGPQRTPQSLYSILGGGMMAGQQATQDAAQRAMQDKLMGMKLKDAEADFANQQLIRDQKLRISKRLAGQSAPGSAPEAPQAMASAMPGAAGSPKIGGPGWLQAYQQQNGLQQLPQPTAGGKPVNQTDAYVQRLITTAQVYAEEGDVDSANKLYEQAAKLRPKVQRWGEVTKDGRTLTQALYDDGTRGDAGGEEVAKDLDFRNVGDMTIGFHPVTGALMVQRRNGNSPDAVLSAATQRRGQDKADARAREANAIAGGNKVVATSTGLRKEFDDLPEVKSYKQALPAYTAIADAATRNTTQSDINIVYGIAKLYDPNSVVREGEYATVANSPNIPERIKGYAQYLSNGGRLTQQVKSEIMAEARSRMQSYESPYMAARQNFTAISQNSGADPSLLFPSEHRSPTAKPQAGSQAYADPEKERRYQEWKRSQGK